MNATHLALLDSFNVCTAGREFIDNGDYDTIADAIAALDPVDNYDWLVWALRLIPADQRALIGVGFFRGGHCNSRDTVTVNAGEAAAIALDGRCIHGNLGRSTKGAFIAVALSNFLNLEVPDNVNAFAANALLTMQAAGMGPATARKQLATYIKGLPWADLVPAPAPCAGGGITVTTNADGSTTICIPGAGAAPVVAANLARPTALQRLRNGDRYYHVTTWGTVEDATFDDSKRTHTSRLANGNAFSTRDNASAAALRWRAAFGTR